MRRLALAWTMMCLGMGCGGGDDGDGDSPSNTAGRPSGGASAGGGTSGGSKSSAGGTANGGMTSGGTSNAGSSSGGGSGTGTGGGTFTESGVCGQRAVAKANATTFDGTQEFYIIGDGGFGEEICVVRFDLKRVGEPPAPCPDCPWAHTLELSNPTVVTDTDGVCAKSELGLTMAKLDEMDGTRGGYGFMEEFLGHDLGAWMKYNPTSMMWEPVSNASWSPGGHEFSFNNRDGDCAY